MKRLHRGKGQPRILNNPASVEKSGLLKAGTFSLFLHIALLLIFSLSQKSTMAKMGPSVYRVTLRPILGDGLPKGDPGSRGSEGLPSSLPGQKLKPVEKSEEEESKKGEVSPEPKRQKPPVSLTRDERVEGLKRSPKKGEKPEREYSSKSLQEALEEIRKKAALDKIRDRVASRQELEKRATMGSSQGTTGSSSESLTGSGPGVGTGGSPTGSPWGSPFGGASALESKLNEYYNMIWEKIKKEWALPGDLSKGKINLETIIVVVIERNGKIQKSWFEKKSGNVYYDQMAMRAIKKAEPLPPIPKEFSDETFEIGIRFHPD
jgi:colicin import membrane protein